MSSCFQVMMAHLWFSINYHVKHPKKGEKNKHIWQKIKFPSSFNNFVRDPRASVGVYMIFMKWICCVLSGEMSFETFTYGTMLRKTKKMAKNPKFQMSQLFFKKKLEETLPRSMTFLRVNRLCTFIDVFWKFSSHYGSILTKKKKIRKKSKL